MDLPEDIKGKYIERRKEDLEVCWNGFVRRDYSEIQRVGHRLKGNGVTFGYVELSSIGLQMESAALSKDPSRVRKILKIFSNWLGKQLS